MSQFTFPWKAEVTEGEDGVTEDVINKWYKTVYEPNFNETFTRLLYYGISQLHLSEREVWLMPFHLLLDLIECDLQFKGLKKAKREVFIDELLG